MPLSKGNNSFFSPFCRKFRQMHLKFPLKFKTVFSFRMFFDVFMLNDHHYALQGKKKKLQY